MIVGQLKNILKHFYSKKNLKTHKKFHNFFIFQELIHEIN